MFWLGAVLSVHNLVCISFDRLLAVIRPIYYRLHHVGLMIGCYVYLVSISLLLFIPNFFLRHFSNDSCSFAVPITASPLHRFLDVHSFLWLFLSYLLPIVFIVTCHVIVIRFVNRANKMNTNSNHEEQSHKGIMKLVKITAALAVSILIFHAAESARYVLASFHLMDYAPGSAEQQVGVLLIALCCCVNPCVTLNTKISVRRFINNHVIKKIPQWKLSTGLWTLSNLPDK
ncbi:unnamed protein product [Echinostoma caproni]|uniref:G-protein coupled receptors family 1 profile domain-containing protein n=1 Tax=Echinostoma caproni TaxID=27848 RepID=A0A3P8EAX1_9TREM|nr:unnamed protein product [Echinostoma caproni]